MVIYQFERIFKAISFYGLTISLNSTSTNKNNFEEEDDIIFYYKKTYRGLLSVAGIISFSVFSQTTFQHKNSVPDIQIQFVPTSKEDFLNDPKESFDIAIEPFSYYNAIYILPFLLSPKSRGYILLNESDPLWEAPLIYPKYFTSNSDLDVLVENVKIVLKLLDTESFKKYDFRFIHILLPASKEFEFGDYWKCLMMEYTNTF
ncbi:hypothetical protein K0M31_012853 [Melipona bicolor]|uniref:Glucose-methanol-choline oxidoreductase C-terminal domain-containing protein n=1 Tax=Melipona bicolor TaxID=60889 RepID=A0AA40FJH6_9HYME|nr:hypothetical protein K0M31_012853 [Melipona bicolor]